jgi:hypothetical protein
LEGEGVDVVAEVAASIAAAEVVVAAGVAAAVVPLEAGTATGLAPAREYLCISLFPR